jgi:anaerobic selenocysteine-containing dehydrogenase
MSNKRIPRRNFLKLSGLVSAAAGLDLVGLRHLGPAEAQAALVAQDEWIPTCCNMCGGTTGIYARVVNGRVIKIEPNSSNPIGVCNISTDFTSLKSTGARMCPKGNAGYYVALRSRSR